jgi:hypothetical protein
MRRLLAAPAAAARLLAVLAPAGIPSCGVSTPTALTTFGAANGKRVQVVKIRDRRPNG